VREETQHDQTDEARLIFSELLLLERKAEGDVIYINARLNVINPKNYQIDRDLMNMIHRF